jgi:hypothetical protein
MVYCMTETNLCPSRSEMWESSPNKRSAATLPRGDVMPWGDVMPGVDVTPGVM